VFVAVACVSLAAVTEASELGEAMLLHVPESSTSLNAPSSDLRGIENSCQTDQE
jgi:hypothetical protein